VQVVALGCQCGFCPYAPQTPTELGQKRTKKNPEHLSTHKECLALLCSWTLKPNFTKLDLSELRIAECWSACLDEGQHPCGRAAGDSCNKCFSMQLSLGSLAYFGPMPWKPKTAQQIINARRVNLIDYYLFVKFSEL
jgi:hypothetical protein